jgi:hypothetical protein
LEERVFQRDRLLIAQAGIGSSARVQNRAQLAHGETAPSRQGKSNGFEEEQAFGDAEGLGEDDTLVETEDAMGCEAQMVFKKETKD